MKTYIITKIDEKKLHKHKHTEITLSLAGAIRLSKNKEIIETKRESRFPRF